MGQTVRVLDQQILFFSSRRRHTILTCDWSSAVCSSDLFLAGGPLWAAPVIRATFARLSRDRAYPAALDFGGAVLALLAYTLVIYLTSGGVGSAAVGTG